MDQSNQNGQNQKEHSGGGINLGNFIPSGKTAGRAGKLTARAATTLGKFLFTTPVGWVVLAIVVVFVITSIIVLSLGAPPMGTSTNPAQTTVSPTLTPPPVL